MCWWVDCFSSYLDKITDMLDDFHVTLIFYDLDRQGQIFQFCFNCHNLFIDEFHSNKTTLMTLPSCGMILIWPQPLYDWPTSGFPFLKKKVERCSRHVVALVSFWGEQPGTIRPLAYDRYRWTTYTGYCSIM